MSHQSEQSSPSTTTLLSSQLDSLSLSPFLPQHLEQIPSSTELVKSLTLASQQTKPLIRSTLLHLPEQGPEDHHELVSWKTSEFAYRKSNSTDSQLPTLARGLFTQPIYSPSSPTASEHQPACHRIAVRGYDKFFNVGEMPWTKPESIRLYTTPPYEVTFKENGCIIFASALSPQRIVVTSKHSLGPSPQNTGPSHAEKGEEWLERHLGAKGRTKSELANELWRRNETAVFELCDDSFEEHVIEYPKEKTGLHLHGLNSNAVKFKTRSMVEVEEFSKDWGFIPTRWITIGSLKELDEFTEKVGLSGKWRGEAIEGFVIRTTMPLLEVENGGGKEGCRPPYEKGQTWFYKVKFDEPYLMYRDWRELTRKMLAEKAGWDERMVHLSSSSSTSDRDGKEVEQEYDGDDSVSVTERQRDGTEEDEKRGKEGGEKEKKSKNALKKEQKRLERKKKEAMAKERAKAVQAGILPPPPPPTKSRRAETLLFVKWCHDRIYGTDKVEAKPGLFESFKFGKGIIALRNAFLSYLETEEGRKELETLKGGGDGEEVGKGSREKDERPFNKLLITPIAVPGVGKTQLALALKHLLEAKGKGKVGHVQSDDYKKKTGFLNFVEKEIEKEGVEVVFADKNNHLFQHRDELIGLVEKVSDPSRSVASGGRKRGGKGRVGKGEDEVTNPNRVKTLALAWRLDQVSLNTLHRTLSERIVMRGQNHQNLVADTKGESGVKEHEAILWRFLEQLEPFRSSLGGQGCQGFGDERFDQVVWLEIGASPKENLRKVYAKVLELLGQEGMEEVEEGELEVALTKASEFKVERKKGVDGKEEGKSSWALAIPKVRYYGISVEIDLERTLERILSESVEEEGDEASSSSSIQAAKTFYQDLKRKGRINKRPHITLVHNSSVEKERIGSKEEEEKVQGSKVRWETYRKLCRKEEEGGHDPGHISFEFEMRNLFWDEKVMALSVDGFRGESGMDEGELRRLQGEDWKPHVTVGTISEEVRPFQAKGLFLDRGGKTEVRSVPLGPIRSNGRLMAMYH